MPDDNGGLIDEFRGRFRFLSNFELCDVEFENDVYPSTEHAYQAAKTFNLMDRANIRDANTCVKVKHLGYKIKLRNDWESVKLSIMEEIIFKKFKNHKHLREKLLLTGDAKLIEGNTWHDNFWGVCSCSNCKNVNVKLNNLGKILMKIRAGFAAASKEE